MTLLKLYTKIKQSTPQIISPTSPKTVKNDNSGKHGKEDSMLAVSSIHSEESSFQEALPPESPRKQTKRRKSRPMSWPFRLSFVEKDSDIGDAHKNDDTDTGLAREPVPHSPNPFISLEALPSQTRVNDVNRTLMILQQQKPIVVTHRKDSWPSVGPAHQSTPPTPIFEQELKHQENSEILT